MLTTDKPSIAELRKAYDRDTFTDEATIIAAAPVLLEIAAAALAVEEQDGLRDSKTTYALRAALAKVTP